jgi:hypothetical protein
MSQSLPVNGILFSNAKHQVIFLNKTLQMMLNYPESAITFFVGKPVHEILGIREDQYQTIAKQIIEQGQVENLPIELSDQSNQKLRVIAKGTLNKDNKGEMIGIDYTFYEELEGSNKVVGKASSIPSELAHEVVRFYFKRQLEGMYQVTTNIGGRKLGDLLNEVINTTAQQQQWNITMQGDKITDDPTSLTIESYEGLLFKVASYVSKVLGQSIMIKQVEKVNAKTNPMTFEFVAAHWYKQL